MIFAMQLFRASADTDSESGEPSQFLCKPRALLAGLGLARGDIARVDPVGILRPASAWPSRMGAAGEKAITLGKRSIRR
jgi:hypothetical protein